LETSIFRVDERIKEDKEGTNWTKEGWETCAGHKVVQIERCEQEGTLKE
jgi:hypothetical protein